MMPSRKSTGLLLILAGVVTTPSLGQDISWTQPYSGNVVYGPLSPDPGKLPMCPDCDCESCKPGGCRGFLRRLFGGTCEHVRTTRRECYYHNQTYHTKYTPPVLPPYCEVGYGYYQTSWRQPAICPDPLEHSGVYAGFPVGDEKPMEPAIPAPAPMPMPMPPGATQQPDLLNELEQQKEAEGKSQVPGPPAGEEKPRYDEALPKTGDMGWKQVTPLARQFYRGPIITPR